MTRDSLPKRLPRFFDEGELHRLLSLRFSDTLIGRRDRAILEVLVATGLRASELLDLRHGDVGDDHVFVRRGKGGRQRFVPLSGRARGAIDAVLVAGSPVDAHVFLNAWRSAPLSRRGLYKVVQGHLRRAGLDGSTHSIRHGLATMLLDRGLDLRSLQVLLGHAQLQTTTVYTAVARASLVRRYRRVGGEA